MNHSWDTQQQLHTQYSDNPTMIPAAVAHSQFNDNPTTINPAAVEPVDFKFID
jgi:hypothetical protein